MDKTSKVLTLHPYFIMFNNPCQVLFKKKFKDLREIIKDNIVKVQSRKGYFLFLNYTISLVGDCVNPFLEKSDIFLRWISKG